MKFSSSFHKVFQKSHFLLNFSHHTLMALRMFWQEFLSSTFKGQYKVYSLNRMPGKKREDVENGGKMIMPPSVLRSLSTYVTFPIFFKLTNERVGKESHAGVLEFIADEGLCFLPNWMMSNLELQEGELLSVENVTLPIATFSKFQPDSPDFLDITNPKAVLENTLRNFACLTVGDLIAINYNKKVHHLRVLETQPETAVSIIECDMNVDFETPLGYVSPQPSVVTEIVPEVTQGNNLFVGAGKRLDGKEKKNSQMNEKYVQNSFPPKGIPDYDYVLGSLTFDRNTKVSDVTNIEITELSPWIGSAQYFKKK